MKKKYIFVLGALLTVLFVGFFLYWNKNKINFSKGKNSTTIEKFNTFSIPYLRSRDYSGSQIVIEENLDDGVNYKRYIASYKSDGLKIYGLLTVPNDKPKSGFPAIIFLHGYLPPKEYVTTERYVQYQDAFARSGYVTYKPDLRGHGQSEGVAVNSNFSEDYVIDTLNAMISIQKFQGVNPSKIGMWGHSNGGGLTLKSIVISKQIKAAVIWGGVVGDYTDLLERYRKQIPWMNNKDAAYDKLATASPNLLVREHGTPSENPDYWKTIEPYNFLQDVSAKVQLHHGELDESVPIEFSKHLYSALKKLKKIVEIYTYPESDHNISQSYDLAMERSISFFDKYLK
jgi:uncharacterized protein